MAAPRKYPQELRDRAMRLVREARQQDPELSLNALWRGVGQRTGVNATRCAAGRSKPRLMPASGPGRQRRMRPGSNSWRRRIGSPNQLWVVDFAYVPTWSGMAFTAFVTDVYSRRIVRWRTTSRMATELPLDALEMALWVRDRAGQKVDGVIHHSDAGSQYTALRYCNRLADVGAIASIGTVGDSYDHALAESIVGLYKTERVKIDGPFQDRRRTRAGDPVPHRPRGDGTCEPDATPRGTPACPTRRNNTREDRQPPEDQLTPITRGIGSERPQGRVATGLVPCRVSRRPWSSRSRSRASRR